MREVTMSWPTCWDHVFRHLDRVKRFQAGYWTALCPAHEDRRPSLSVRVLGGKLRFYCHAQRCTQQEILEALSSRALRELTYEDLHEDNRHYTGRPPARRARATAVAITATYPYLDEAGTTLFESVRFEPGSAGALKDFRYRRPNPDWAPGQDPDLEWLWNLTGARRVLYRFPELVAAAERSRNLPPGRRPWVLLLEGEKDCETARGLGVLGTTCACGAKKWHLTELDVLEGMRLCVVPDVDPPDPRQMVNPGMEHALQAINLLHGRAAEIKLLRLPVAEGKDFTDWAHRFPPGTAPQAVRKALGRLVGAAAAWGPWGPQVRPRDPFLDDVADEAERLWREEYRVHTPAELAGSIDVQLHAFKGDLAEAVRGKKKPDPASLLARLTRLAAEVLRGVGDLRLEEAGRRRERTQE
jgi:hypothetical protein